MLYDFVRKSALLESEELLEDRMVKYGGELAPKFGWCVIYVGGPGSGKRSSTKFLSRLQGDYYNADDLKEIERMWNIKDPETGRPHSDNFKTPEGKKIPVLDKDGNQVYKNGKPLFTDENRNMGNSEFVSELHQEMKPLSKKWKRSILANPENLKGRERLPNIIFDITGDEASKVMEIVDKLKQFGYKIAVIWVLSTVERALRNNTNRPRQVDTDNVFIPKHLGVISAVEQIFKSGEIRKIDEFWVIDAAIEINPNTDPVAYHDAQNVYHIPTTEDGLNTFENIVKRIEYNKSELNRLKQKRKELNLK